MIENFIIQSRDILDSVIINNKNTISEMPEVQILSLLLDHDEALSNKKINVDIFQSEICGMVDSKSLPHDGLLNATID